jgi:hypothetical protein
MSHCKSIYTYTGRVLALSGLILAQWGCSGTDGYPAAATGTDFTSPLREDNADAAAVPANVSPPDDACDGDGVTGVCMTPVGANAGFVLCAQGAQTCSKGHWTSCFTDATSAPVSGWEPESVGCNPPPEACARDRETRTCVKQLPPTPEASNCYHGTQTCNGHVWGPCIP